jgi:hypothetical protein
MSFIKENLPVPQDYYENIAGLKLTGGGQWRTTRCEFHGGSDSMRIHLKSGAFVCMNCGEKGGDVLAYHQLAHSLEFIEAAKSLKAWSNDGISSSYKQSPVSSRMMLEVVAFEVRVVAILASDMSNGKPISESDNDRLILASSRISRVAEELQHV